MRTNVGACLLWMVTLALGAAGQTGAPQKNVSDSVSPEKRALIKELYTVTKVNEMAQKSVNIVLDQLARQVPAMLAQSLGDLRELKGKEKDEFDKSLAESSSRVLDRLKEILPQRINWEETLDQVFYPVYDKYFSEQELRDLVAFYKSPTGQKAIDVMPDLFREGLEKSSELLNERLAKLVNEVLEEEKQRLLKK